MLGFRLRNSLRSDLGLQMVNSWGTREVAEPQALKLGHTRSHLEADHQVLPPEVLIQRCMSNQPPRGC